MSEEKKNEVTGDVKEEARQLSEEELKKVNCGDNFNVTDWNGYSSQS